MNDEFMTNEELLHRARIITNATTQPWFPFYQQDVLQKREMIISKIKGAKKEDSAWKYMGMLQGFDECATIYEEFKSILQQQNQEEPADATPAEL